MLQPVTDLKVDDRNLAQNSNSSLGSRLVRAKGIG